VDRLESTIAKLAATLRPYLVQAGSDALQPGLNISLLRVGIPQPVLESRVYQDAVAATMQDAALQPLRPAPDGTPVSLTGSLPGIGLIMTNIPAQVVGMAAFEVAVTKGILPMDALVACALEHLDKMRRIAAGQTIEIRLLAALKGFTLPEGVMCDTQLGSLQLMDPRMQGPEPTWTVWTPQLGLPPPALFTTSMAYHVDVVRPGEEAPKTDVGPFGDFDPLVFPMRLAVLLASDQGLPLVRPQLVQATALLPFGIAFTWAPGGEDAHLEEPRALTDGEIHAVVRFAAALAPQDTGSIRIVMSRTLSAATERRQPADILIDAVTAWEGLVGTEGETSFRVTAALARLLERDFDRRVERYKALKKVYDVRSKVVHGEHRPDELVQRNADLAVAVALDALRTVLTDADWLLRFSKSQERADAILLGDPRLARGRIQ
jgi:Apea-like HEPN